MKWNLANIYGLTPETYQLPILYFSHFKDTHREKALLNKAHALTKSVNMGIWVVGTPNQFFIRGS